MKYKIEIEPVEVFTTSGESAGWLCGTCRGFFKTKEGAAHHCAERICNCGAPIEYLHHSSCRACLLREQKASMERSALRAAERCKKVSWRDWSDPVYSDHEERFYDTVHDLVEDLDGLPIEGVVWGTRRVPLRLDAASILEWALEEQHEGSYTDEHVTSLQNLLNGWCDQQDIYLWGEPGVVVLMDDHPAKGVAK